VYKSISNLQGGKYGSHTLVDRTSGTFADDAVDIDTSRFPQLTLVSRKKMWSPSLAPTIRVSHVNTSVGIHTYERSIVVVNVWSSIETMRICKWRSGSASEIMTRLDLIAGGNSSALRVRKSKKERQREREITGSDCRCEGWRCQLEWQRLWRWRLGFSWSPCPPHIYIRADRPPLPKPTSRTSPPIGLIPSMVQSARVGPRESLVIWNKGVNVTSWLRA
jgi:hypothetical protein